MPLLQLLHAEGLESRRGDDRSGVLEQQIHILRDLVDRNDEGPYTSPERVGIADLFDRAWRDRAEYDDTVVAEPHRLGRDITLAAALLPDSDGNSAGPCREERVLRNPRGGPGVPELQDFKYLSCSFGRGTRDRGQPALEPDGRRIGRGGKREDVFDVHQRTIREAERGRKVREAVEHSADEINACGIDVRRAKLEAVAASGVGARRIDGAAARPRDPVQHDTGIREGDGIAPAPKDTPGHAHTRS